MCDRDLQRILGVAIEQPGVAPLRLVVVVEVPVELAQLVWGDGRTVGVGTFVV